MSLHARVANELLTIDTVPRRWIVVVRALCNLFSRSRRSAAATRAVVRLHCVQQLDQKVIIDNVIGAIFHFAQRTYHHRHVAALVVGREIFLLLLGEALLAAAMETLEQLRAIVDGQILLAPATFSRNFDFLIVRLLFINLEMCR